MHRPQFPLALPTYLATILTVVSGCAPTIEAIPRELQQGISQEVTFHQVIENPKAFIGKSVLWGGTILKTTVRQDGTVLEILHRPLDPNSRPIRTDQSEGRFLVAQPGKFLDPAIFERGREVTVVGEITGERVQPLGEIKYRYPFLIAKHIHLWAQPRISPFPPYWYSSRFRGYPYWYFRGYPFYVFPFPPC